MYIYTNIYIYISHVTLIPEPSGSSIKKNMIRWAFRPRGVCDHLPPEGGGSLFHWGTLCRQIAPLFHTSGAPF